MISVCQFLACALVLQPHSHVPDGSDHFPRHPLKLPSTSGCLNLSARSRNARVDWLAVLESPVARRMSGRIECGAKEPLEIIVLVATAAEAVLAAAAEVAVVASEPSVGMAG